VQDLAASFADFWNNNRARRPPIDLPLARPWPDRIRIHCNDPARLLFPIRGMYLDAINRARQHIYLTNAYFIPDRVVLSALVAAAERGVDVRVLLPWQSNHVTADWLAHSCFGRCLRAGIRLFGYQNAMIHAKTATIDGIWSTVGTANLDRLSLSGNYELNMEIQDTSFAANMEQIFAHDLENATEITPEQWHSRPWYVRAGEMILRPLGPLI
jgi:cardiolipin synthase